MIKLKDLIKEIEFSTQKAFDTYSKAHKLRPDTKVKVAGKNTTAGAASQVKGTSVFGKAGGASAKPDGMDTVNAIAAGTGLRTTAVAGWADTNGVNLASISKDLKSKKLKPMDLMTAISGNPGNKYAKDIIAKYSQSGGSSPSPKSDISKYDTSGKTDYFEKYDKLPKNIKNLMSKHFGSGDDEYSYKELQNIQKDFESNGWTFKYGLDATPYELKPQTEPTSKPKEARKGNPSVNKDAKKNAEKFGITPEKLGKEEYPKTMLKAAVEALTDANFHDEARKLIAAIEGKPEWAKKVEYPSMDDPKYKEKMTDIRTNGVDSSEYWDSDDNTRDYGTSVSQKSGWNGTDAADGIAFTLRMNGFHKQADMIQSAVDEQPSTKLSSVLPK